MFITFEGGEGSGKTTAIRTVAYELKANDISVHRFAEPGSTPIGHKLREILLFHPTTAQDETTPLAELMLFCASRAQFTETVLAPLIASEPNSILLCDRYVDSTFAYQFYGRKLPWRSVHNSADASTNGIQPDLTLFFDIQPEEALERLSAERRNRLDTEALDFHKRVYRGYHWLMDLDAKKRWRVVDATQSPEQVVAQAMNIILQAYQEKQTP